MSFSEKVAIVTGGTRGIGRAIVTALAAAGCKVAFTYLRAEAEASQIVSQHEGSVAAYQHDAADYATTKEVVGKIYEQWGGVDFLINNAGTLANKALALMNEEEWDKVLDTNLKSVFNFSRCVIPHLMKKRTGRIVTIASVGGIRGLSGQTNYCASKGGAVAFTAALAKEVARSNITVNAIAPGFITTDMTSSIPDAFRMGILKNIPAGRFGTVDELTPAVLFLLSPGAQYITGQTLVIDGGLSC